jgi:NtrC-family two-component system sensor histidine kinase KinB
MAQDQNRALLELLMGVSREVATALDLRTVLQRLMYAAIQNVGGERGSIVVLDDVGNPIDATIIYGKKFKDHSAQQLSETVERGLAGWVVRHRKPALVPDTSKDERWLRRPDDSTEKSGSKSAICVPLMARERLVGVLTLVHSVPNVFTDEHLHLMQAIADQASVAVLNARLYTESQRTARVMSALADGAAAINTSLEMPEVWRRILNQTIQALQVETVALGLLESDGELVFQAAAGQNSGNILGRRVPPGQGLVGLVAREGRGLVVPNVMADKRYSEVDQFAGIEMRSVAIAPIQAQGMVIGVLQAINPVSKVFDPDAVIVMTGLGSLAGTTIQNARLFERLQQAHERYRGLYDDSIDPIVITDWDGKVLEANRPAIELSGYDQAALRKMKIDELHELRVEKLGEKFQSLRESDGRAYESVLYKHNSGVVPVEVHARRVEFEETDSLQWIFRDITERKELDSLREDMTAMIYHDLRSPLANIVSSLDMLNTMLPDDEATRSMLTIATNSTARIQRLINSLLDINRLESGQEILEQKAVDPALLVQEAIQDVEPGAIGRRQTLQKQLAPALPLIFVDVDMIHRVFVNLLENAIKFTPVESRIEIGGRADNADWIKMWVRDNGPGIPLAEQDRIFEKFMRVRGKDKPVGLGVGLSFCRLAVQGHGGRIWLESEPGKGTTFWLTLPIARVKKTGKLLRQTGRLELKDE